MCSCGIIQVHSDSNRNGTTVVYGPLEVPRILHALIRVEHTPQPCFPVRTPLHPELGLHELPLVGLACLFI
jgi:hypothetical protein